MHQFKTLLLSIIAFFLITGSALAQAPRFAVISDPHLYDTELGITGPAFEAYLARDRKMLRESEAILASALEKIKAQQPDFVIIPGDLTKDGELSSHMKLAEYLADLEKSGIEAFVVPGNHDINNPHAVAFEGETTTPVAHVTPEEFTGIYGPFGYDQAIARDPNSLSYVAEPAKGFWLFGIDTCKYDDNLANGHPETGGAISEETLNWILDMLFEAKMRHKTVAGFLHHGMLEHYRGQSRLFAEYVIEDWQAVAQTLSAAGLQLVFTGHYHANDITQSDWEEDRIYDVETGSLITYPSPFRLVDLHGRHAAAVRTFYVDEIDYDTGGMSFPDYAENFLYQGLVSIATYILTLPPDQGGFALSLEEAMNEAPFVAQTFMAHYAGDESPDGATLGQIISYTGSSDPRYQSLGQALGSLWTDLAPADGSALLSLNPAISLSVLGSYTTNIFDKSAAEISAYDPATQTLFVVNGEDNVVDMLDISDPSAPVHIDIIDISPYGAAPNSVAVSCGLVAVAVEAQNPQDNGQVALFNTSGEFLKSFTAGALPDMVTFTPDGRYILTANEGEPNDDYSVDPEGSITIIDLKRGIYRAKVKQADFRRFNHKKEALTAKGVRIFGPEATVAQDLEPEYITVVPHSPFAWVALQENNALAKVNIRSGRVMKVMPLGYKDHSLAGNGIDASDKDGIINIRPYDNVLGMYQPDAIASYRVFGRTYIVTANEGDGRDYETFTDESKVGKLDLDPKAFPNAEDLQEKAALGRLKVTDTLGDTDGDGDFDKLYAYGSRSFSIFKATRRGLVQVFDSGDQFEQITAAAFPNDFNSDNDENDSFDSRSDAKGPEPEGLTIGKIGFRTYAFIGLERMGGIMVYDITRPCSPVFVQFINNRDFSGDAEAGTAGDLAPEGIAFIPADESPNGSPMLAVANEVSGTTTLYSIEVKNKMFFCIR
jgi:UDP-2,3-diacylglucosamine pyrophosphatase LpxH